MMLWFSLGALALVAAATGIILPALLGRRPVNRDHSARLNVRIARRRLREIAPALAGDHEVAAQTRAEIESALLDDLPAHATPATGPPKTPGKAWTALILAAIPLLGGGLYLALGAPAALVPGALSAARQPPAPDKAPPVAVLMEQLEEKLAANPGNAEGWALAGRTYMNLGRFADAERAYDTLHQLVGDDPHVLSAWAEAALMADDGAFSPRIRTRIERALELQPRHYTALWLAALDAESRGAPRQALAYLERLLPLAGARGRGDAEVREFIARMERLAEPATADAAVALAGDAGADADVGTDAGLVRVRVRLDPQLAGEVGAGQPVYVFAKAVNGPPTPLAVRRYRVAELPVAVTLDDSMAMVEGMKLSAFERVSVMARLSRSGDPAPRPGDLESAAVTTPTRNGAPLDLVINRVVGEDAGR